MYLSLINRIALLTPPGKVFNCSFRNNRRSTTKRRLAFVSYSSTKKSPSSRPDDCSSRFCFNSSSKIFVLVFASDIWKCWLSSTNSRANVSVYSCLFIWEKHWIKSNIKIYTYSRRVRFLVGDTLWSSVLFLLLLVAGEKLELLLLWLRRILLCLPPLWLRDLLVLLFIFSKVLNKN